MNKLYLIIAVGGVICGAYVCGANIADAKCRAKTVQQNFAELQKYQNQISQIKRKNHETVYKTGVRDVRRILRDKYTISE